MKGAGLLLLTLCIWCQSAARAEPVPTAPALDLRLRPVFAALDADALHARVWTWGWVGLYGAATLAQLAIIPFTADEGDRVDLWVGSTSAFVGALGIAFVPLNVQSSEGLPAEPDAALTEASRRVRVGAAAERLATAWYTHVANFGVNLALGLILGVGFHRWTSAAISFSAGFVIGEVTIFTVPTRLTHAEGYASQAPTVMPRGAGVAIAW